MAQNKVAITSLIGDRVTVDVHGMLRVGGVCIGRVVQDENGLKLLEVKDRMKSRSVARQREFVYATVNTLIDALLELNEAKK